MFLKLTVKCTALFLALSVTVFLILAFLRLISPFLSLLTTLLCPQHGKEYSKCQLISECCFSRDQLWLTNHLYLDGGSHPDFQTIPWAPWPYFILSNTTFTLRRAFWQSTVKLSLAQLFLSRPLLDWSHNGQRSNTHRLFWVRLYNCQKYSESYIFINFPKIGMKLCAGCHPARVMIGCCSLLSKCWWADVSIPGSLCLEIALPSTWRIFNSNVCWLLTMSREGRQLFTGSCLLRQGSASAAMATSHCLRGNYP